MSQTSLPTQQQTAAITNSLFERIVAFERGALDSIGGSAANFIANIHTDSPVLIEVGSNTGLFCSICKKHFPNSKMFLFEPVEEYHLFSKIRLVDQTNVEFFNMALADTEGELELFCDTNNLGWNTIVKEKTDNLNNLRKVSCMPLSKFILERGLLNGIDAIKIDVEGAEYLILEDLLQVVAASTKKPMLLVEIGWGNQHPKWERVKATLEQYFQLGYQREPIDIYGTYDLLLLPSTEPNK